MSFYSTPEIACLGSKELLRLFREVNSYAQGLKIEILSKKRRQPIGEAHPVTTVGLTHQTPLIQIVDSLGQGQKVEAIAHELAHLILVYRYGLGVIGRRIPRPGDSGDVFRFFMSMRGDWIYLLGQTANTVHHLILVDHLKKEYGIQSNLHLRLLHHNFGVIAKDYSRDKESLYAKGLIAFEYERLIGNMERVINIFCQTEFFWKAYHSAKKYFGRYDSRSIPAPLSYEENILSFLGVLGYLREDFIFFPGGKRNFCLKF